jgi:hypothetical protein
VGGSNPTPALLPPNCINPRSAIEDNLLCMHACFVLSKTSAELVAILAGIGGIVYACKDRNAGCISLKTESSD